MANLFDQLTFNTLRNNQLPNNQNTNQYQRYQNYDDAQEYDENYNENFGKSFAGIGRFDPSNMMLPSNLSQDLGASNYQDLGNSTVIDESRIPGRIQKELPTNLGIMQNFKNKFTTPTMAFMKMMAGERSPQKQAAYDAITGGRSFGTGQGTIGMYGGNEYELYNSPSGSKVGSDILGYGQGQEKNFDSMFGSKSLEEMEDKTLSKALDRLAKGKAISQRLRNVLTAKGLIGDNIGDSISKTGTVKGVTRPGDGGSSSGGYTGPKTYSFDRGAFQRSGGQRASKDGFTDPGKESYGPHRAEGGRMAYGGRAGYQEGELVEDASMVEATPQGMMEENVESVQKEPSREQLEVIALEIFKQPLEQLNEEQLMVVYQAAMEQEPSEEEIQFAAQESPAEGIASLV